MFRHDLGNAAYENKSISLRFVLECKADHFVVGIEPVSFKRMLGLFVSHSSKQQLPTAMPIVVSNRNA